MRFLPPPTSWKPRVAAIGAGGGCAALANFGLERLTGAQLQDSWQLLLGLFLTGALGSALYWRVYFWLYRKATA